MTGDGLAGASQGVGDDGRTRGVRRWRQLRPDPPTARQGDAEAGHRARARPRSRPDGSTSASSDGPHRGETIRTKVTGDQDPGYGSTAKMLGESAAAFLDLDTSVVGGGFWTPASAFGDALVERLEAHAGVRFDVL